MSVNNLCDHTTDSDSDSDSDQSLIKQERCKVSQSKKMGKGLKGKKITPKKHYSGPLEKLTWHNIGCSENVCTGDDENKSRGCKPEPG